MREKIDTYRRVRELLLRVRQTQSNTELRSLFAAPQLLPWQAELPEANRQKARVEALVAYLQDKRSVDGERVLVLVLRELAAQIDETDDRHPQLLALAQALAANPTAPETSPYRGLFPFRAEDSAFFFGREDVVEQLLDAVQRQPPLVPLLGASGSGKSSVVFAGLLPRLEATGGWCTHVFRPGRHPFEALAATLVDALDPGLPTVTRQEEIGRLADGLAHGTLTLEPFLSRLLQKAPDGTRLLLIADQFEELFTQAPEDVHAPFLNTWLADMPLPLTRLLTMRADFLGQALRYPILADALQAGDIKLAPMRPAQLQAAIEEPARLVDVTFEPGLVARILGDLEGAPGNLPLLQFALTQLWRRQSWGQMTHAAYEAIGGVEGALAQYADEVYAALSPNEQDRVRHLFVQLVAPGLGTEDTRRVAERAELGDVQWALVQRLADRRLVVTGKLREEGTSETVEVAHEALIQYWQRLREWMEEDRVFRAWQERLRVQVQQWQETARDRGALLRGAPLAEAKRWWAVKQLSAAENQYIKASMEQYMAEVEERAAKRRRELEQARRLAEEAEARTRAESQRASEQAAAAQQLRRRAYWLGSLLLFAVLLAALSFLLFNRARDSETAAVSSEATAVAESTRAAVNLATAKAAEGTAEAERLNAQAEAESRATAQADAEVARNQEAERAVEAEAERQRAEQQAALAFTRQLAAQSLALQERHLDRSLLLAVEVAAITTTWDTRNSLLASLQTNPLLASFLHGHTSAVYSVAFNPDGETLASASADDTVILWDVTTRSPLGEPFVGHTDSVFSVAFSPDGKTLASGSLDGTIILWDVATRRPLGEPLAGHSEWVLSVAFSPDGETLASGSAAGTIILWDVDSRQPVGEPLAGHSSSVLSVAFSPDGETLASGSDDSTIILWDVAARQPLGEPLADHSDWVLSVVFSPDGETLASGSADHTVILWDMAAHLPLGEPLAGHTNMVRSVAFSPDGGTLASGSNDGTIIIWGVASRRPLVEPLAGHTSAVLSVSFSPDGESLASGSDDDTIILWDVTARLPLGEPLVGHSDWVRSVAFSPDGKTLASASFDGSIVLWDVAARQPLDELLAEHIGPVHSVAFSPDGAMLAAAGDEGIIILWDVTSRQPLGAPLAGHSSSVLSVAFSPDGKTLASASDDGTIILWDMASRQPLGDPLTGHSSAVLSVAFSPDGEILASGSDDRTIILWDMASRQMLGSPITGHLSSVLSVAFSPNGEALASANSDFTAILWDLDSQPTVGERLTGHSNWVVSVAFSPDGETLASGSDDHSIILWDVASRQPLGEPLAGHNGSVLSVAFSPDGETLASGSADGIIALWDVNPASWRARACARANRTLTSEEWSYYFADAPSFERSPTCASPTSP